ncbi:MAG TPA: energy transducer TonB [bacterium]|nr:energy transducer TonB [bacterium]HQG45403.1 energy transducer TonB [bacterium]HQI48398.1 energy transducer TonB [bacterium]HQJ64486.1 energy transducer TonB [bacterium]
MKVIRTIGWLVILASLGAGCASHGRLKPPRVASEIPLDYPLSAQLQRLEGEVSLTVFVNPAGKPEEVSLSESSGYDILDEAALKFVEKLTFNPGTLDDKPVGAWTRLVLRYKLTEMAFEKDRWIADVLTLQKDIAKESKPEEREALLRRLYTLYVGCMTYVESNEDPAINSIIRLAVDRQREEHWQPFWDHYAAPFVLFDDFLQRYPDSEVAEQGRQDLIRYIMDMETKIRMKSLKSRRISSSAAQLLNLLEVRLKSLQPEIQTKP